MNNIRSFLKKNVVVGISFIAALISVFFAPVTNYTRYIDLDMLAVLFGLMAVVAGFSHNKVFDRLAELLIRFSGNTRRLAFCLVAAVFFLSMLVTNDVALITFVPFTVMVYEQTKKSPIYVIALETIAANMGGALTPVGNPNNLYIFTLSGMSLAEFLSITVPIAGISLLMLILFCMFIKPVPVSINIKKNTVIQNKRFLVLYGILFVLCLLAVFDIIDTITAFASVIVVIAICEPYLYKNIDYGLLLTFAFIFIFTGNIRNIPAVSAEIQQIISGHELASTVILSQFITNVPATFMLTEFTDNYRAILIGTNIASLGTLISSLASLISLKIYAASEKADTKKYVIVFTALNLVFLAVLYPVSSFVLLR
ncbi:MAG: citrate transporter [Oscillospiraceae bacterium]|nr:citrate transporter [Oscillospiraceae bacterium]